MTGQVLDGIVIILALILNPLARRRRRREAEAEAEAPRPSEEPPATATPVAEKRDVEVRGDLKDIKPQDTC